jgi:hypothetical protein
LVKILLMCRIGRGVSYCNGVSPRGKPYYDSILTMLGDQYAPHAMATLTHYEIQRKLGSSVAQRQAREALELIRQNVINSRLIEALDFLIANIEKNGKCILDSRFKTLTQGYINW